MVGMTIEDFMCTWDIYPIFDYDGLNWELQDLMYIGQTRADKRAGFGKYVVTDEFWENEDYYQKWPNTIAGWIKWLDDRMENFYINKCPNKTNNPYIDNIIRK